MTTPTRNDTRIDRLMTEFGIGYSQNVKDRFIATKVGYTAPVDAETDYYPIWTKADWFRSEMIKLHRDTPSPAAHPRLSKERYSCHNFRLHTTINIKDEAEAQIKLRQGKTKWLIEQALMARDIEVAAQIFATGKWTSNTEQTGVAASPTGAQFLQWNDASSTPIADCNTARETVRQGCGFEANTLVIGPIVKNKLLEHPDILDLYKYTVGGVPTLDQLRQALQMDNLIVGAAMQNTAAEGATAVMGDIWGKHALFMYVPPSMTEDTPRPVSNFAWSQFDNVTENMASIRRWEINNPRKEALEVEMYFGCEISANDAGVFYKTAVA